MDAAHLDRYRAALGDWLACAIGGSEQPAARASAAAGNGLTGRVVALGAAGHVLDFDDTYLPGLAHLSATVAPAALAVAAQRGARAGDLLEAYAAGFEAMGALARSTHPDLYDGGWHPTAVCGVAGAAVAAAHLLGLGADGARSAAGLALLRSGGLRSAFGTDGKALQVGLAAAAGVAAAELVAAGATIDLAGVLDGPAGWRAAFRAPRADLDRARADCGAAIAENWIKAWPCCLQTHSAIEAALQLRARDGGPPRGAITVVVHPVSRQAAALDDVADGLQAKFSIPYLAAFALLRGAPGPGDFGAAHADVRALAAGRVGVRVDPALLESEARLEVDGEPAAQIEAALGSPGRPLSAQQIAAKRDALGGDRLAGALDDLGAPASAIADLLAPR